MGEFKLLINGQLVRGAAALSVINPSTEDILAEAPLADLAQLNAAVAAARAAFRSWHARPIRERSRFLLRLADALEARQEEFVPLLTQEQGKPLPQSAFEIGGSIGTIRYFASTELPLNVLKDEDAQKIFEQRTPLGVVAAIMPWNAPLLLFMTKVAPALITGNTVVAKPAPTTPLTTLRFGELCAEILPPGVINIITLEDHLGSALTSHSDVAKVAFTGSIETGRRVMESSARSLKRLTLELGGNDAAIVLDDADPKQIAPQIFANAMAMSGQVCVAIKRLYVHDSIYDEMCEELATLARAAVVDDGLKEGSQMGPLQNKTQFEKVKAYLAEARQSGTIVAGGEVLHRKGYYITPAIVRDIPDSARLVREEQFGPVLPVLRYSHISDAVARANGTPFGLGASVWTSNPNRAFEIARKIDAGTVWVNKHFDFSPDVPFGGAKQSGIGYEFGQQGLEAFTQLKIINMAK